MAAESHLRVLHLEDDELDAELVMRAFEEQDLRARITRVTSREDFLRELETGEFDLILSDYSVPAFDGRTALRLARERCPGIPFIYLSGTIGEERAVEVLREGATDYVLKDRMFRLGAVVRRALEETASRVRQTQVEQLLRATNDQLQRLLAASPAVIYSAPFPPGSVATFVSENVKTRFGWDAHDFTDKPRFWISHVHDDDRSLVESRMASLDASDPGPLTYRFLHADGTYRWIEDRINLVRDAAGRPVEIVGSWVDVSGIKRMEEEMTRMEEQFRQAQKLEAIGSLSGGVAHDFNNIIMVIQAYSQNLLEKLPQRSELRHEAEEIRKAGNRAADLTHQLLAFSRKETLNPRHIDPDATVVALSKMLGRLIGDNIRLVLDLRGERCLIYCDPTQLDQILINLVVNARDAMPNGGEVTIATRVMTAPPRGEEAAFSREVCISVKDIGVGMTKDVQARIFDPFFTTKPEGKGTGLGLSMVYGAVHQNRGRIAVASEPGRGTTMSVFFESVVGASAATGTAAAMTEFSLSSLTFLLVEDNENVRDALGAMLAHLGARVIAAANGEEALNVFGEKGRMIDVVLSDVMMPGISGPELGRRLRALKPDLRLIFCTGYLGDIELIEKESLGDVPMLQKPFDTATLTETVRALYEGASSTG